jgi:1-acyl-sn-glycerol-3-phosphate acyltransferase
MNQHRNMDLIEMARFGARTTAFVGTTFAMYGALDVETLLRPEQHRREVLFRWIGRYGRALCHIFGVHVAAMGRYVDNGDLYPAASPNGVGRVFIMNHRSGMDIPISLTLVEANIVSRADLAGWPVIGPAARRVGTLFVDRSSKESGASVMKVMRTAIESGHAVMLYPEGTAYRGDEVRPFRAGAFKLAKDAHAEIVPIGIAYADHEMSYGDESFVDHMKRAAAAPRIDVAVQVGEPISASDEDVTDLRNRCHGVVQDLVNTARARL